MNRLLEQLIIWGCYWRYRTNIYSLHWAGFSYCLVLIKNMILQIKSAPSFVLIVQMVHREEIKASSSSSYWWHLVEEPSSRHLCINTHLQELYSHASYMVPNKQWDLPPFLLGNSINIFLVSMGIILNGCYMVIFIYSFYQWAVFLAFTLLQAMLGELSIFTLR